MRLHGDTKNCLNWDDGHIPYNQLSTVLSEAVAGFAHLYGYGDSKYKLFSQLLGRPVHNLEDFYFPSPRHLRHKFNWFKPCNRNPAFRCATRHSYSLYEWLMYHVQNISYVTRPDDKTRHTVHLFSAEQHWSATFSHSALRWHHEDVISLLRSPLRNHVHAGLPVAPLHLLRKRQSRLLSSQSNRTSRLLFEWW
jgi:hypothetical protein